MNISENFQLTKIRKTPPVPAGINALPCLIAGKFKSRSRLRKNFLKEALHIYEKNAFLQGLSDSQLQSKLFKLREIFKSQKKITPEVIRESFLHIQEAVFRKLGFYPFAEQIAGALGLYRGYIIEMATGEGKTVTAAMAAVLRGWSGLPCHVITANDYLAARDASIMQPLFRFCGISAGSVTSEMKPKKRKENYLKNVTYTTAKEVLADFLRDRILLGKRQNFQKRLISHWCENEEILPANIVQRGLHTAIVDEADNVLIDEAVTPLIISKEEPNEAFEKACFCASQISRNLHLNEHYKRDEKFRTVIFIKDIEAEIKKYAAEHPSPFSGLLFQKDLVRKAVVAKEFFIRDHQYVIEDGKIVIVDESTGRKMPMRSWSDGLHQMVELKEGLEMTPVKETQARLSFQRFFRFYPCFSGMTGTGKEAAREFWLIYAAPMMLIPSHKKNRRILHPLKVFPDKRSKINAILGEIEKIHREGRPVLIGTRTVAESEMIASLLQKKNFNCKVINAVRSEEEAAIIAEAGKKAAITVATNMAGRGTDIKISSEVSRLGGLHVIATECHRSSRIDRQLFGRAARQGDPGSAIAFASFEDELLTQNLPRRLWPVLKTRPKTAIKAAQRMAGRKDYQSRFSVQKTDSWLDESLRFASEDIQ